MHTYNGKKTWIRYLCLRKLKSEKECLCKKYFEPNLFTFSCTAVNVHFIFLSTDCCEHVLQHAVQCRLHHVRDRYTN